MFFRFQSPDFSRFRFSGLVLGYESRVQFQVLEVAFGYLFNVFKTIAELCKFGLNLRGRGKLLVKCRGEKTNILSYFLVFSVWCNSKKFVLLYF